MQTSDARNDLKWLAMWFSFFFFLSICFVSFATCFSISRFRKCTTYKCNKVSSIVSHNNEDATECSIALVFEYCLLFVVVLFFWPKTDRHNTMRPRFYAQTYMRRIKRCVATTRCQELSYCHLNSISDQTAICLHSTLGGKHPPSNEMNTHSFRGTENSMSF